LDSYDEGLKERLEKMMNDLEENRSRLNKAKKIFKELGDSMDDSVTKDVRSELDEIEKAMDKLQNEFNIEMGVDTNYNYSKVIIEEPELNLFPKTQQELVYYMLSVLNSDERDHQLVLTTHSPYILFALNNCMMGGLVKDNIPEKERHSFVSQTAWIDPKKVSIYEIHDGSLQTIQDEDGIIEDNYLNKAYKENSAEYLSLLNYFEDEE
jgi:predicted ATP-dependent endonuclease of OLD family